MINVRDGPGWHLYNGVIDVVHTYPNHNRRPLYPIASCREPPGHFAETDPAIQALAANQG